MKVNRPIARDDGMSKGALVVASRQTHGAEREVSRAHVTHGFAAVAFYTGGRARVELKGEWKLGQGDVLLVPRASRIA